MKILYNNTEDIPRLYRRRGLFFRSVGVQSPTERKQFFELPLLVKSRALKNEKMDAFTALHLYRRKDVVEKAFGNIKDRLNMRRTLCKSERSLDGKLFLEFVALILISHLNHKMKETNLYKTYSMQQLLDKLDVIECFEDEGHSLRVGELLEKQMDIYKTLGVALPTSSC